MQGKLKADSQVSYWATDLPLMLRSVYKMIGAHPPARADLMLIDLVEWLLRRPDRRPRRVHRSWALRNKILLPLEIQGLDHITSCMQAGGDLLPFLGTATSTLRQRHKEVPKSGLAKGKRRWQPDWMFSDWGIHHFHLGSDLGAKGKKVLRSDRVLFAYLTNTDAYLIDVLAHKKTDGGVAWADKKILETLCSEWPDVLERFELKGLMPPAKDDDFNSSEIHSLRQAGGTPMLTIHNKVYLGPGMGMATDRSSTRAVRLSSDIRYELNCIEQIFRDFSKDAKAHLYIDINASIGYFVPAKNTFFPILDTGTSQSWARWFFQRLIQEVSIFQESAANEIWLRPGVKVR